MINEKNEKLDSYCFSLGKLKFKPILSNKLRHLFILNVNLLKECDNYRLKVFQIPLLSECLISILLSDVVNAFFYFTPINQTKLIKYKVKDLFYFTPEKS
jgi:hypothetical protein